MKRTLALTLLAVVAVCAPASAKPPKKLIRWTYAITIKGDATYHYASEQPAIGGSLSTTDDLTFRWKSKMPRFQLLDGRVLSTAVGKVKLSAVEAKRHISMPDPANGVATGDCAGTTATPGSATLTEGLLAPSGKQKDANLDLTPFTTVSAPFTCVGKLNGPGAIALLDRTPKGDTFLINFDLPDQAIGQGKVIQLFDQRSYGCPAPPSEFTTTCEFRMKGTVTLRRTGKKVLGRVR